jgi:putative ABC transport system substrate-binding protein
MTLLKRFGDAKPERLPALVAELVGAKVDVIVTGAAQRIEAARKATNTIPIVMAAVGDAVGAGYVASLSRLGGNITGLTLIATDQSAKRLQLIKELSPTVARVAVLWNANASGHRLQIREMEQAAPALGIALQSLPIRSVDEIDARLRLAVEGNAQALLTMDDAVVQSQREHIAQLATRQRLPLMSEFRPGTESGGLISYGPDIGNIWQRAAVFVDKRETR